MRRRLRKCSRKAAAAGGRAGGAAQDHHPCQHQQRHISAGGGEMKGLARRARAQAAPVHPLAPEHPNIARSATDHVTPVLLESPELLLLLLHPPTHPYFSLSVVGGGRPRRPPHSDIYAAAGRLGRAVLSSPQHRHNNNNILC
jgi:hypothetical protein